MRRTGTPHRQPGQRSRLALRLLAVCVAATVPLVFVEASPSALASDGGVGTDSSTTPTDFQAWTSLTDFAGGRTSGGATVTRQGGGALTLRPGLELRRVDLTVVPDRLRDHRAGGELAGDDAQGQLGRDPAERRDR